MRTLINVAAPLITFILMVSVGLDLSAGRLRQVWDRPGLIVAGLVGPVMLLPPLALGIVAVLQPSPVTTTGLLLVAACPIGGLSNAYSLLAGAATALSVTLTALSCIGAVVTIPVIAVVIETLHGQSLARGVPAAALATQLVLWLGLPVSLGMAWRRFRPAAAGRWQAALQRVGFLLLAALVVAVLAASRLGAGHLGEMGLIAALFIVGSFGLGWATGGLSGADGPARFTLATEFATRNMGVATLMAVTMLGRVDLATFAAVYLLTEVPLALAAIAWFRRAPGVRPGSPTGAPGHAG